MPIVKLPDNSSWNTSSAVTKTNLKAYSDDAIVLAPTNWLPNQYAIELDADGEPIGWRLEEGEQPDGYHVFVTTADGDASTATQQTLVSRSLNNPSWIGNQPFINGDPLPANPAEFAPLQAPPAPTLEVTPSTDVGYAAGTWGVALAMVDAGDRHTTLSSVANVTLTAGQCIRQGIPQDVPDGTEAIAIYLIPPAAAGGAGDISTARFQYLVKVGREKSYDMTGPFRWNGRKAPTKNETYLGRAPKMQYGPTARTGDIVKKRAPHNLRAHSYRFLAVYTTQTGETPAGIISDERVIATTENRRAFYLNPPGEPAGTTGIKYFALIDGNYYQVVLARSPFKSDFAYSFEFEPRVYGMPEDRQKQLHIQNLLVEAEPPTDDTSGIASYDEAPPTPVAFGTTRPAAATYGVFVCYSQGEKLSRPSRMVSITVTSTDVIRVVFSSPINIFANSEGSEQKQSGHPFSWTRTATDAAAGYPVHSEGIFYLSANAANANLTPDWTSTAANIDPLSSYTISGALEVTSWSSGTATVELEERDSANAVLATTTVDSLSVAGFARLKKSFGPGGSGADVTWNAATANVRLRFKLSGNPRNLTARAYNLAGHPFLGTQRKYELSKKGSYAADNPDPSPHLPYSSFSFHANSPAPGVPSLTSLTGGSTSTTSVTPKDIVDFEAMTTTVAPVQSGWTHTLSGTATSTVQTTAAIEGTKGWRVKDTGTSSASTAYLERSYSASQVNGATLAVRHFRKVVIAPTSSPSIIATEILSASSVQMAYVRLYNTGQILLYVRNGAGVTTSATASATVAVGDSLDMELLVSGGNTSSGAAELKIGKNGASRVTVATLSGISWSSSSPRRVRVGATEATAAVTWEYNIDRIVVTDAGDNVTTTPVTPTVTGSPRPYELPDYPSRAGTTLETQDFESGALSAGWTSNQIPATGTTLAVQAGAAIDGGFGLRVQSSSAASAPDLYVQKTIGTLRTSLGSSARFQIDALPSTGNVKLMRITNAASALTLGEIYLDSTGALFVQPYNALGATVGSAVQIAASLVATNVITLEMVAQNANTGAGTLSVWYALGAGTKNLMFQASGLNWDALYAERIRIGGFSASAVSTFNLRVDTQIITDGGLTIYRAFDSLGAEINQHYLWLHPNEPTEAGTGIFSDGKIQVEPGTWTYAVMGRHSYVPTANLPARPHFLTLYAPETVDLDPIEIGSPYGSGVTGTSGWTDWTLANFTVPAGYTMLKISSKDISGGEYVWQETLLAKGNLNTQALRDAARGYGLSSTGSAEVVLDTASPNDLTGVMAALHVGNRAADAFASEVPAGSTFTADFASSPTGSGYSAYVSDPSTIPPGRFVKIRGTFTSAGATTAVWGINNLWASYNLGTATLLRDDRSELSGGTIAGNLGLVYYLAEYVTSRPGGHVFRKPTSEAIGRMGAPQVGFYTEDGLREFLENQLILDWVIESLHLGSSATQDGSCIWIRLGALVSEPEFIELPERKINSLRRLAAVVEIPDLEVLEVGPLS